MEKAVIGADRRIKFKVTSGVDWLRSWSELRRAGYKPTGRYKDEGGSWWFVFEKGDA